MDPLTLFSYVPLIGIFVFLVALVVIIAVVIKNRRQNNDIVAPVPQRKGLLSDKRIIASLIVVIVLVVGLGTSLVVVKNQQDTRSQARVVEDSVPDGTGGQMTSPPPEDTGSGGSNNNNNSGSNTSTNTNTNTNTQPSDPAGCCGGDGDCAKYGSGQVCNVPNGACSTGKSCNDSSSGKFHQGCISGVCVQIPGDGANDCAACNWTSPSAVTDQGNHITHACLSDVSCSSGGCTAKNNCSYAVTVCGGTYNCEGNTSGYCGPAWSGVAQNGCVAIQPGTTGKVGTVEKTGCGSWQADITVQGYTGDKGLASANGYDSSECKTTTNGGSPPSGPNPTPTPTPPITVTGAACSQVVADKTLSTLAIGDTVNFTGYGWVDTAADSIDQINFIISKDGVEVSNTNVAAVRASSKDVAGQYYYSAVKAYTIPAIGSYSVKIQAHWVGGNVWRD